MPGTDSLGLRPTVLFALLFCAAGLAGATDPPSATLNPVSGDIEVTDSHASGGLYRIRYVVEPAGGGTSQPVLLTDADADDLGPRIQVDPDGNTWIVWWRGSSTPEVRFRVRDYATGSWSAEAPVSAEGVSARNPEIALDGSVIWVTYEVASTSSTSIVVSATDDGPEPFPGLTSIGTTSFPEPDPLIQAAFGHLWVSWVDSPTLLLWAEYDHDGSEWRPTQTLSYAGSSVDLARKALYESFQ